MAQKMLKPKKDDRIERALADPDAYFLEARMRARREILAEMKQEAARRPKSRLFRSCKKSSSG